MEASLRIRIEASAPYQDSLRWELSRKYFRSQGTEVFVSGEVPCAITSNECFAAQNAAVLFAALQAEPPAANEPVRVLELAGGMGGFALHFIEAFQARCAAAGLDYGERLEYWLSDDASATLKALAAHPVFAAHLASGRLRLCQLDVTRPQTARSLDGEPLDLSPGRFACLIANYLFCALPAAMLLYREQGTPDQPVLADAPWAGKLWQLESELYGSLSPTQTRPAALTLAEFWQQLATALAHVEPRGLAPEQTAPARATACRLAAQLRRQAHELPAGAAQLHSQLCAWLVTAWLEETAGPPTPEPGALGERLYCALLEPALQALPWSQTQIDESLNFVPLPAPDPALADLLPALLAGYGSASFTYPVAALQALADLLPILSPGGVLLVSDKGLYGREVLRGERVLPASLHGNSLAHDLNFPLLALWLQARGYACNWTSDASAALQTLLAGPNLPPPLQQAFSAEFIAQNFNIDSQYLFEAGSLLQSQKRPAEALFYWLRALRYRPRDAMLRYRLGMAYLALKDPEKALDCLAQPHDGYFLGRELDWLRAEAYRQAREYAQAIQIYAGLLASSKHPQQQARLHQMLGDCLRALGRLDEAREQIASALGFSPQDPKLHQMLAELSRP